MKVIRWSGLGIFIGVMSVILLVTHFFMDSWIRTGFEMVASDTVGAEVNVGRVEHSYRPFGVTLVGLQITDIDKPTHNKVQVESIAATIDLWPLLMNKVIVEQLTVAKLEFDVKRVSVGAVFRESAVRTSKEDDNDTIGLGVEIPSVDTLLASASLKTPTAQQALEDSYHAHDQELRQRYNDLPDEKVLEHYEEKIKAITERDYGTPADFLTAQEELSALKKELEVEKKKLSVFKNSASLASKDIGVKIAGLKAASEDDYDNLKGMLAGDLAGLSEITALLFGEQAKAWSKRLFSAYNIIVPMLESKKAQDLDVERASGRWVEFSETGPLPDFLIKKAHFSAVWEGQGFDSTWQDITTEHDVLGRATTFNVASLNTQKWKSLSLDGDFWLAASGLKANQKWAVEEIVLNELSLFADNALTGELKQANLNSVGDLSIRDGEMLGVGNIDLIDLVLKMEGRNTFTSNVATMLNELKNIRMEAGVTGDFQNPVFSLASDLDKQLQKSLASGVGAEGQERLIELQKKLGLMGSDTVDAGNGKLGDWRQWQDIANGKTESIQGMLNAKLEDQIDKQKSRLEDELKKRFF
ncbi:TIGR03545 family protein [Teredinibacter purpureus]|uniref:TIGR03545 family protein n=1 Tax=Teredinibacter purpureus TaxID=2731756 RepID=UPI0005F76486|nr:TIGR03545 family protein [Teredinibacter purpureus]